MDVNSSRSITLLPTSFLGWVSCLLSRSSKKLPTHQMSKEDAKPKKSKDDTAPNNNKKHMKCHKYRCP
eukprot:2565342-Ditylum_brightwellii.AAC.1